MRWYDEVASTNDVAMACAERGADAGLVIVADSQTAGRGRHGRQWCSPPGAGLYVSMVLRPEPRAVPLLTIAAGVGLADAIRAAAGLSPALKWPNDVYVGIRKLAGILAESGSSSAGVAHVVLGFGINLRPAAYPTEVAARATSLAFELGRDVDRGVLLVECLAALAARYDALQAGNTGVILDAWRGYARPLLGRVVECDAREGRLRGIAEDVDESGALLVRTGEGIARVMSGEVRWM